MHFRGLSLLRTQVLLLRALQETPERVLSQAGVVEALKLVLRLLGRDRGLFHVLSSGGVEEEETGTDSQGRNLELHLLKVD